MSIDAMKTALEALEYPGPSWAESRKAAADALRLAIEQAEKQEPVQCEPQPAVTEDGYCDWVCPNPASYLMQCCDCGLIHEVQTRVAKYEPRPSEVYEVVSDPDVQAQWRMRRRDDISLKQAEKQEPVAWISKHGVVYPFDAKDEVHPINELQPLYTAPPQRQPLTDEEIDALVPSPVPVVAVRYLQTFARAIERAHGIGS